MKAAKCPNCGANITIDETKKAGICEYCKTAFVSEDAIHQYNITNNVVNNIMAGSINLTEINIDNLMELLENAMKSSNYIEAYKYSTKILEVNNTIAKAWFYKGLASALQSTTKNINFDEVAVCMKKAYSLDSETYSQTKIFEEYSKLVKAVIQLSGKQFCDFIAEDTFETIKNNFLVIVNKTKELSDLLNCDGVDFLLIIEFACLKVVTYCFNAYLETKQEFGFEKSKQTDYALSRYINKSTIIEILLEQIIDYAKDDTKVKIYGLIIDINKDLKDCCSYERDFDSYERSKELSDEEKYKCEQKIIKLSALKKVLKEKVNKEYWNNHKDEYNEIISNIEFNKNELNKLEAELKEAGFFQFKTKYEIKQKITHFENILKELNKKLTRD